MNIKVSRYPVPTEEERAADAAWLRDEAGPGAGVVYPSDVWEAYIEPEDGRWIVFVGTDGSLTVYGRREPDGAVMGDSRVTVP